MVGKDNVGICGLGGLNVGNCGASNLACSTGATLAVFGEVLVKGRLKRGRVKRRLGCGLATMASFSDRTVSVVAAAANGLRARMAGMASVEREVVVSCCSKCCSQ